MRSVLDVTAMCSVCRRPRCPPITVTADTPLPATSSVSMLVSRVAFRVAPNWRSPVSVIVSAACAAVDRVEESARVVQREAVIAAAAMSRVGRRAVVHRQIEGVGLRAAASVSLPAPPMMLKWPSFSAAPLKVSVSEAPSAVALIVSVAPDATFASTVVRL